MKIKAQMAMVMNLDKCLACHTCSIPCKNTWTAPAGSDYIWFNNVETKPGIGYPKQWENQKRWKGGWKLGFDRRLKLVSGGKIDNLLTIFCNEHLPEMKDYYEPWNYNYRYLTNAPSQERQPAVGPRSSVTGELMGTVEWGPDWEDDLAGVNVTGLEDVNFKGMQAEAYLKYKTVFMFHLPRICNHCLHPACVAACPSQALYKRDEDGIVLADQTRCRSWRKCMTACPYKKVYLNWKTFRSEKCVFCYPRVDAGEPPLCAQSCVGRIRYVGVMLYDVDRVKELASTPDDAGLYQAQLEAFLNPNDPEVIERAKKDGIPDPYLSAARRSPVYKMASEWKIALPLHPEYRTLPMVWYVPPLSPMIKAGAGAEDDLDNMRIPVKYLANLFAAGDEGPVRQALGKLMAMRAFMREARVVSNSLYNDTGDRPSGQNDFAANPWNADDQLPEAAAKTLGKYGLTGADGRAMYRLLAIARYKDRFVVPSAHKEFADDMDKLKASYGFPERLS